MFGLCILMKSVRSMLVDDDDVECGVWMFGNVQAR